MAVKERLAMGIRNATISTLLLMVVTLPAQAIPLSAAGEVPSLAPMLERVTPAVVNISTYSTHRAMVNPLLNDPFFRRFFNVPERQYRSRPEQRQQSAGSGVIVNARDGIVMTNYHVIKDAEKVQVSLTDGRSYTADVIGTDPDLDIAIPAISAQDLTAVNLTNSDKLRVGDYVIAIGNPFGLGQTVTTGIVSALGRTGLGIEGFENFIQTDASINPGNSGGALVDLHGNLVGINTAIMAPAGGNVGIGFAIPANMARASMEQILKHGEVRRGQLGIGMQDVNPDLRDALGLKNGQQGVLIAAVSEGSPAARAGLQVGDVVTAVDGVPVTSVGQLRSLIGIKNIGQRADVTVVRDGRNKHVSVPIDAPLAYGSSANLHPLLEGVIFEMQERERRLIVAQLEPGTIGSRSGLQVGDIVIGANKRDVRDVDDLQRALALNRRSVLMHINRNGYLLYVVIR